ncbi:MULTISPECIES: carbohydrate ABC transporter permease [Limnochorda]|uniref:carbohydrate ABC transporter permease n=1 Tax=Limnochorda TaxID=1676651 RepID=UPI0018178ED5|nr:ABC transporter permease subunit [Limnochorda pilosa]MBO2486439.1 hypothetical protein [Bacillota bacterium]MBO2520008.1 hypothetical protein [Bacillota bacterium]NMA72071.1 ABC transporter permease subunit [Bacillota bacterium]
MVHRPVFRNRLLPYLLVLPQVAISVIFFFWPAAASLRYAVMRASPFGDRLFYVGLANFERLFTSAQYHRSLVTTLVFSLGVTVLGMLIALGLAVLANQKIRGLPAYRTALLWPYGIAPVVAGIIWLFLAHPAYGVLTYYLRAATGLSFNWLVDGRIALGLVIVASVWARLGYNIAFFLAGLQQIPQTLLEAATVDGASALQRFWHVTRPLLSPITLFLLVTNTTFSLFETFGVIDAITRGGPGGATETLVYKAYKDGFIALDVGSSGAQSVVLMVLAIILTALQFRFGERRVTY